VDLAGSQSISRTRLSPHASRTLSQKHKPSSHRANLREKETKYINKSLCALSDVFLALSKQQSYVPYRNSKMTYLLSDCLGGNSKTLMIVCVNPGRNCVSETLHSLNFAARVKIGTFVRSVLLLH